MFNKGKWTSLVAVTVTSLTVSAGALAYEQPDNPYKRNNVKGTCYFSSKTCDGFSRDHINREACYIDKGGMSWKPPQTNQCFTIRE